MQRGRARNSMQISETSQADSTTSPNPTESRRGVQRLLRMGAIAAASALVGGLAAAWYYRKTLKTLQDAESSAVTSEFRIPDSETEYDL